MPAITAKSLSAKVGQFTLKVDEDMDGHLNLTISHADGSRVLVDTEEGPDCEDHEISMRMTTETIEANA